MSQDADAIVVEARLAGLVAATELAAAGRTVIMVDQEPEASLGGQAFWSFDGLFIVGSPEQRRMGVRDSLDMAWQDWVGSAGRDRPGDELTRTGGTVDGVRGSILAPLAAVSGQSTAREAVGEFELHEPSAERSGIR